MILQRQLAALAMAVGATIATVNVASSQVPEATASERVVDIVTRDGTRLRATYFPAAKPGPGVLLYHQHNRTRRSWEQVARGLAAVGIHTLTIDSRSHGESGGSYDQWSDPHMHDARSGYWPGDLDAAFRFLIAQPGVDSAVIGVGGAGLLGVDNSVETARRHPDAVKSLVLLSGETLSPEITFLRQASNLPGLFVVSDQDEYPPTVEAMEWLWASSSSPDKRLVHFAAAKEAPWLWYEPYDIGTVPATGNHGTDLFEPHPELPGMIVEWFLTTLVRTPGHAPVDGVTAAPVLNRLESPGGVEEVTRELMEARRTDPHAQLFPEVSVDIIGEDHLRDGDPHTAIGVLRLNAIAYPTSADAQDDLADAFLSAGQLDSARVHARTALALLDAHTAPVSSWSDTEERRGQIRRSIERTLTAVHASAATIRDCPECPELVIVPAGAFVMGSSPDEKAWAVGHGSSKGSVADEAPQHSVSVRSFAIGKNDITRGEYAAFMQATGRATAVGCGRDSYTWNLDSALSWQQPGFNQTDRDPVVCVSWNDAQAYVAWLNGKVGGSGSGPYRLPTEAEWEYAARGGTSTLFSWGDEVTGADDHAWYRNNSDGHTHPVGTRQANAFGIHDMVGDVWQWTADCYAESYATATSNGAAAPEHNSCMRVDRGGSWLHPAWMLRAATRERNPPEFRDRIMGFRVAKTLAEIHG